MRNDIKLTIELVPSSAWYTNVRSNVSQGEWDKIRKQCYRLANDVCEICGDTSKNQGKQYNLECHEIWDYDDQNKVQKLTRLIGLCNHCHTVKHPGLAGMQNRMDIVYKQLNKVNGMTHHEAEEYLNESFQVWLERSRYKWELDITYLDGYLKGIVDYENLLEQKKLDAGRRYKEMLNEKLRLEDKLKQTHKSYSDHFIEALNKNFTGEDLRIRKESYKKYLNERERKENIRKKWGEYLQQQQEHNKEENN